MELLPKHFKKLKSNLGGIRMPKLEKYFKHQDSNRIAIFLFSLGLLLFILISTVAPFRSKLFFFLFSKPYSQAASTVTVTGIAVNNSSAKVFFNPVPGAKDYRIYDITNPNN